MILSSACIKQSGWSVRYRHLAYRQSQKRLYSVMMVQIEPDLLGNKKLG